MLLVHRSILVTSSRGCPQQVRVVLVDFGERHRHTDKRAALYRSRPPADQSGKRVASWTGKSPVTPDLIRCVSGVSTRILARMSQGCYAVNGPVEFKLFHASNAMR